MNTDTITTTDRAALGRRLRAAREAALLTQRDVETRTGIDQSVLARMESGKRKVAALEVMRLAALYGVPVETLFSIGAADTAGGEGGEVVRVGLLNKDRNDSAPVQVRQVA